MWSQNLWFLCAILIVNSQDYEDEEYTSLEKDEKKLSADILLLLDHFKQADPIGLPGEYVADPYPMPDTKQSLLLGTTLYLKDILVYGISKFRILYVNADIQRMELQAALKVDVLQARGNYTKSPWFGVETHGPFTIDISGLNITASATLVVNRKGKLITEDVEIDAVLKTINVKFEHLDLVGKTFQGIFNTGGPFLFNSLKPYILKEARAKIRTEINKKLNEIAGYLQFPNTVSPFDMVLFGIRERLRNINHLDPYQLKDMHTEVNIFSISLYGTSISGMSSFYKVDNITFKLENNTIEIDFDIGTQELKGLTHWNISSIGGLISASTGSFSLEYLSARIVVSQPLDTRRTPILKELKIEIGNTQIRCDSGGTIDYIIEFAINIFLNLLRFQIIDSIEGPLKERVQGELNTLNVEDIIKEELSKLDEVYYSAGFKLSNFNGPGIKNIVYDEDEFFNF